MYCKSFCFVFKSHHFTSQLLDKQLSQMTPLPPAPPPGTCPHFLSPQRVYCKILSARGVYSGELERTRGGFVFFREKHSCTIIKFGDHPTVELKSWGNSKFWILQYFLYHAIFLVNGGYRRLIQEKSWEAGFESVATFLNLIGTGNKQRISPSNCR